jgi:hypothetical protein
VSRIRCPSSSSSLAKVAFFSDFVSTSNAFSLGTIDVQFILPRTLFDACTAFEESFGAVWEVSDALLFLHENMKSVAMMNNPFFVMAFSLSDLQALRVAILA